MQGHEGGVSQVIVWRDSVYYDGGDNLTTDTKNILKGGATCNNGGGGRGGSLQGGCPGGRLT